jgi:hypothetical protein
MVTIKVIVPAVTVVTAVAAIALVVRGRGRVLVLVLDDPHPDEVAQRQEIWMDDLVLT